MASSEPFARLPTLRTDRLTLRPIRIEDAQDMYDDARDPQMAEYTSWMPHLSVDDSRTFIRAVLARYDSGEVAPWGIENHADGRFIGTCGYVSWWRHDRWAEVGYAIGRRYWGQGLTTEACRSIIDFGFHEMDLNRVQARCNTENIASARVMEKCGMQHEGTLRQILFTKGRFVDLHIYGLLRREWQGLETGDLLCP